MDLRTTTVIATFLAATAGLHAGDDVLWHVPDPSGTTLSTDYSTVYGGAFPRDTEVADDFEATGLIERLEVPGRGCGQCSAPIVDGVFVRLYEWGGHGPGALQHEVFIDADSPDFTWDGGSYPYTLYITLPEPIEVSGWHYISVQVAFGGSGGVWNFLKNNLFNAINDTVQIRDNLDDGVWEEESDADVVLTIFGQATAAMPVVDSVSRTTVTPSDRIIVNGSAFGAPGDGELLVNGHAAIVSTWSATEIIGYVPETVAPGPAELTVVNLGLESDALPITVVPRTANGRVQWVFEGIGSYSTIAPVTGPDGTVYFDDVAGFLYAMTPDGGLKWIVDPLLGQQGGGDEAPLQVADDGTVYVATNPLGPTVELVAIDPDGGHRWTFTVPHALTWQAGPGIGPDGRLYGALNAASLLGNPYDVLAVNPDGTFAWGALADPFVFEDASGGAAMRFGPTSPGGPIDQMLFTADRNGDGRNWGFDLDDGDQNFATPTAGGNDVGQGQLANNRDSGDFYMMEFGGIGGAGWGLQSFEPSGERAWRFDPGIASGATRPAVGADGTIYFGWDGGRLSAVDPDGDERWRIHEPISYRAVTPSPSGEVVLASGWQGTEEPAFVEARRASDGELIWRQELVDDEGALVSVYSPPYFAPDGESAYITAIERMQTPDSVLRVFALDTSSEARDMPEDVNGDGAVDVDDLVAVMLSWGPCDACPTDINADGAVDVDDLVMVLLAWS